MQWDRILDSRIVSIESDDVFHTHLDQFLQCQCTVEGFSAGTSMLAALIQNGMITLIRLAFPAMAAMIRFRF